MKLRLLSGVLAVCVLFCGSLTACNAPKEKTKYTTQSFDYFDTVTVITGYESSQEDFDAVAEDILSQLADYHKLYNIYHRFDGVSNLCTVNDLTEGAHSTVKVDGRIIDMLLYAKQMYNLTDGMMNVAMGSVLSLWHDYRTVGMDNPANAQLPPADRLKEAAQHTDINGLVIDEKKSTVTLTDPQMKLDVGAIAKGYATEQIALSLEQKGISGYVINVGGNVRTLGTKPDGTPWTVGVESSDGGDYLAYLQLSGQSLVTSGSYQRYYTVDGKRYHHIIDPDTQMPADRGYVSVSVLCKDAGLGDALSTSLFCLSQKEGLALVESTDDVEAMWVAEDGTQRVSSGWNKYVKE